MVQETKLRGPLVLSLEPHEIPPNEIRDVKVEMTIVGGKVVHTCMDDG